MTTQHDDRARLIKGLRDLRDIDFDDLFVKAAALLAADGQAGGENEADDLLRRLGLAPDQYRTDGGYINHLKVKAAIKNPNDYPRLNQCQHHFVHSADLGGRVCKLCGHPERSASPAATSAAQAAQPLTDAELELCRQWFDNVQDMNAVFLEKADYLLAEKLYQHLGMRVTSSIKAGSQKEQP